MYQVYFDWLLGIIFSKDVTKTVRYLTLLNEFRVFPVMKTNLGTVQLCKTSDVNVRIMLMSENPGISCIT